VLNTRRKSPSACSAASEFARPIISLRRAGSPAASSTTSRYCASSGSRAGARVPGARCRGSRRRSLSRR
jgi:hypothetical protein